MLYCVADTLAVAMNHYERRCQKCEETRSLSEFGEDLRRVDHKSTICNTCKEKLEIEKILNRKAIVFNTDDAEIRIKRSQIALDYYPVGMLSEMLANQIFIMKELKNGK